MVKVSRGCFDDPVPRLLEAAVTALVSGEFLSAQRALIGIDTEALRRARDKAARSLKGRVPAPRVRGTAGGRTAISLSRARAIWQADSYICRYCGKHTIDLEVLKALSDTFPDELPYHKNWKFDESHIVYWTHSASIEHVVPLAREGGNQDDNLVTSCYECNDLKGDRLNEEVGYELRPRATASWQGLADFLPAILAALAARPSSLRQGLPSPRAAVTVRAVPASVELSIGVPDGAFILAALPHHTQRRKYAVASEGAGIRLTEMWRDSRSGKWVASRNSTFVHTPADLSAVKILRTAAPAPGSTE